MTTVRWLWIVSGLFPLFSMTVLRPFYDFTQHRPFCVCKTIFSPFAAAAYELLKKTQHTEAEPSEMADKMSRKWGCKSVQVHRNNYIMLSRQQSFRVWINGALSLPLLNNVNETSWTIIGVACGGRLLLHVWCHWANSSAGLRSIKQIVTDSEWNAACLLHFFLTAVFFLFSLLLAS